MSVEYYEDRSEALTIDEVLSPQFSVNFLPNRSDILHFGITSSAYWIRSRLERSRARRHANYRIWPTKAGFRGGAGRH